jgi:hypothetical protein
MMNAKANEIIPKLYTPKILVKKGRVSNSIAKLNPWRTVSDKKFSKSFCHTLFLTNDEILLKKLKIF